MLEETPPSPTTPTTPTTLRSPIGTGPKDEHAAIVRRRIEGVLIVRPQGALDADSVTTVVDVIRDAEVPVVIDLDDCIVVEPDLFEHLTSHLTGSDRDIGERMVCTVCRRLSARRLLARSRSLRRIPMFQSVEDAVQAQVMARNGFGDGWRRA